jgi:hypothetical protein
MHLKRVLLIIIDLGGYARFGQFRAITLVHAEEILSALIESVLDKVELPLKIAKLEGNAVVFLYAEVSPHEEQKTAINLLDQVEAMYKQVESETQALRSARSHCECEACQTLNEFDFKVFLHVGEVAIKQIRQFTELAGEDVILIHRLVKNTIPARKYCAMTPQFEARIGSHPMKPIERHSVSIADFGDVPLGVVYPTNGERNVTE